jgi:hypothetical protein
LNQYLTLGRTTRSGVALRSKWPPVLCASREKAGPDKAPAF